MAVGSYGPNTRFKLVKVMLGSWAIIVKYYPDLTGNKG